MAFLLLLLSLVGAACSQGNSNVATLHTLARYATQPWNARCLDGSAYEIWVSQAPPASPNANKWVIDIMGGAWCQDLASCAERAYGTGCFLGSSNASCFNANAERCANKTERMQFSCLPACNGARWCGGLFTNDSSTNALTHDWNQVLLPYKDGQSFTGDVADPVLVPYKGSTVPLHFRGKANFLAAVHYLMTALGMAQATEVALTGNSAGGLATYYHADALAALLPAARVWAAPDSGFFMANVPTYPSWRKGLLSMVAMANATSALNANCLAAQANPATCAFPEVLAPFINTPLFVMNSRYDPALYGIAGGLSGKNATAVNELGRLFLDNMAATVLTPGRPTAAFVSACAQHCGQWAQGTDGDFNVTITHLQAIPALMQWRDSGYKQQLWVNAPGDTFPCTDCCRGGQ